MDPETAARLQILEDRAAIEALLQDYYAAVDTLHDLEGIVACFTPDGVFDLVDLGLRIFHGHDEIRDFFRGAFADTQRHAHHVTNVRITRLTRHDATATGYVFAKAQGRDGSWITVHCKYELTVVRTPAGWKISRFDEDALLPFGDDVARLHSSA